MHIFCRFLKIFNNLQGLAKQLCVLMSLCDFFQIQKLFIGFEATKKIFLSTIIFVRLLLVVLENDFE